MRHKKTPESDMSPEEEALVKRVDSMMNAEPQPADEAEDASSAVDKKAGTSKRSVKPATKPAVQPAAEKVTPAAGTAESASPPIHDSSTSTAPEIPAALLKKIKVDTADESPAEKPPLKLDNHVDASGLPEIPEADQPQPDETDGTPEAAKSAESETVNDSELGSVPLNDKQTDKAVDDIVAHEGDQILALEDARNNRQAAAGAAAKSGFKAKIKALLKSKWTWLSVVVLLIALFAVPVTRYKLLGLVVKKAVTITVLDSQTNTAVSHAQIRLGGATGQTDAEGKAVIKAGVGPQNLIVEKQYYQAKQQPYFVGLTNSKPVKVSLKATGRLVPLTATNKITGKPVAGAEIKVLKTTVKTNSKGKATVALPTGKDVQPAHLTAPGYNQADVELKVTNQTVPENSFALVPAGHIYVLSNASGTLDVVKTNLDGSGRKVVLEGTGREQPATTSLLASRDWRYLVLKARRDNSEALYLIDTANDKLTAFDTSNAAFSLIGWYNHSFLYKVAKNGQPAWQNGNQALKSYDAERQQLNQLDQSQAEGSENGYAYQEFDNFYLVNNGVVYTAIWYGIGTPGANTFDLAAKNTVIRGVQFPGQTKKDYQSFKATTVGAIRAVLDKPDEVYYSVYSTEQARGLGYKYQNQAVQPAAVDSFDFSRDYPTYLLSPTGSQTVWPELRDGRNTVLVGDAGGQNGKPLPALTGYRPYGWLTDKYILVSKNDSELYIAPAAVSNNSAPLKITDYYKPAQTYAGYGYGYGGL